MYEEQRIQSINEIASTLLGCTVDKVQLKILSSIENNYRISATYGLSSITCCFNFSSDLRVKKRMENDLILTLLEAYTIPEYYTPSTNYTQVKTEFIKRYISQKHKYSIDDIFFNSCIVN